MFWARALAVGGGSYGWDRNHLDQDKGRGNVRLNVRRMAPILGSVILGVAFGIGTAVLGRPAHKLWQELLKNLWCGQAGTQYF